MWRIPEYVDDANEEPKYFENLTRKMKKRKSPQFSIARFAGQLTVGFFYGTLMRMAIPYETPAYLVGVGISFGITVGVYIVGNIGREQGGFLKPFIACLFTNLLLTIMTEVEANYMLCALVSSLTFNWFRSYKQKYEQKTFCRRVFLMWFYVTLFLSLWLSFAYFNAEVTTEDGETVKFREAVNHFFKSPAWLEFTDSLNQIYEQGKRQGWKSIYDEIVKALDPKGEANARRVLGVTETTTEKEIKQIYKKLAREWHPDRYRGDNKKEAEQKFMEIAEAYEILTSKKTSHTRTEKERTEF